MQDRIPVPRSGRATPLLRRWAFCIQNRERWLIEKRSSTGRWPGMWQFVTTPANGSSPTARNVNAAASVRSDPPRKIGTIAHALTHRRYIFDVFVCATDNGIADSASRPRAWSTLRGLSRFPLPRPHQRIADMIRACENA
jgi:adenine-specific DNA glycosylase